MARYEHLPIYKQALDAAVHFERVATGRDKLPVLLTLRERLEELVVLMRLAKEVQAFQSFNAYRHAVEAVVSVCRQNEGWLRSLGAKGNDNKARGPESARH
jgi:L-amino acid N-acyltransferase YncA